MKDDKPILVAGAAGFLGSHLVDALLVHDYRVVGVDNFIHTSTSEVYGDPAVHPHKFLPLPGDDPKQRRPDITRAQSKLQWEPKVELATGLGRMVEWVKKLNL